MFRQLVGGTIILLRGVHILVHDERYPDFSKWENNMVKTKSGLLLAPEDFVLTYGSQKRSHFSWIEAIGFERKLLRPNGWRLPTAEEWEEIISGYGSTTKMLEETNLGYHGHVSPCTMRRYREKFSRFYVFERGLTGCYWSSTELVRYHPPIEDNSSNDYTPSAEPIFKSAYAMYLSGAVSRRTFVSIFPKEYGYNIRCVADT